MTAAGDLFESATCHLPRLMPRKGDYVGHLRRALVAYADAVDVLASTDPVSIAIRAERARIRALCDGLVRAHEAVLSARSDEGWSYMRGAVDAVRQELYVLVSERLPGDVLGSLFRVRRGRVGAGMDRSGLFHVPFDKREHVAPQRFSVAGVPMLYLGSTVFVCWDELGRPDMDDLWVASVRLRQNQQVRVLNFGYRPVVLASAMQGASSPSSASVVRLLTAFGVLWPLMASCLMQKRFQGVPFIEEYILPQFLTRYIAEIDEIDGIRYFSTNFASNGRSLMPEVLNFVFPAMPIARSGYSRRLRKLFEMSTPVPWNLVLPLGPPPNVAPPGPRQGMGIVQLVKGHPVEYAQTEFARIEGMLAVYPHRAV